jgi:hypothetical protein
MSSSKLAYTKSTLTALPPGLLEEKRQGGSETMRQQRRFQNLNGAALPSSSSLYNRSSKDANSPTKKEPESQNPHMEDQERQIASGVATGVVGTLVGGPVVGVALGAGAVYASNQKGWLGDASRSMAEVALEVRNRAIELDQKHQITQKTQEQSQRIWTEAQKININPVVENAKEVALSSVNNADQFLKKNQVLERGVQGARSAAQWAAKAILSNKEKRQSKSPVRPVK